MTRDATRPWWASSGPVDGGADPAEDPIERHREARRGTAEPTPAWWPAGFPTVDAADPAAPEDGPAVESAPAEERGAAGEPGAARGADEARGASDDRAGTADDPAVHRPELCGICPLCTAFRALEELRPELATHLAEAARHLAAAVRVLADPGGGATPPTGDGRAPRTASGMERIDLE